MILRDSLSKSEKGSDTTSYPVANQAKIYTPQNLCQEKSQEFEKLILGSPEDRYGVLSEFSRVNLAHVPKCLIYTKLCGRR